ncbi:NAC transcription factor 29-like [Vicia villosa]|uniref:NAC transcription factor 29-like n=1 Tax=Vicia villosa TaxID=3911 RepID=UPI00273ACD61|nr:NAC transcription factor 29-like [Vicia villosa]
MYFFTPRSQKYENGQCPDRVVENHGFWKATGKENAVMDNYIEIGFKRTLVFYNGKQGKAKELDDYQTLLVRFLNINPQYTLRPGEPLHSDVNFIFGVKSLAERGLTELYIKQQETVRQLAVNETRREAAEHEAALKTQMEAMQSKYQRQMKVMVKRQYDMKAQMRQFMQSFGGNQNVGSYAPTDQENENDDNFLDPD